jgi:hypothetical protein
VRTTDSRRTSLDVRKVPHADIAMSKKEVADRNGMCGFFLLVEIIVKYRLARSGKDPFDVLGPDRYLY